MYVGRYSKLQYYYTSSPRSRWTGEGNIKNNDKTIFYNGNRNGKLRDKQIHEYYSQTTHDGILKAMIESNEENVKHMWKNIQTIVSDGAKKCLGMCKSTKKKTWFNVSCKEIKDRRNKLREIALKHPTNENKEQYTASRNEANKTLRREKKD